LVDIDLIRELVKLMSENDLAEIRLKDGTEQIALSRRTAEPPAVMTGMPGTPPQYVATAPPAPLPTDSRPAPAVQIVDENAGLVAVTSPMVGTFYAAPNPQSPPFVSVGSAISASTVVCIIEAMKVFNEIKAELNGLIAKILVTNGSAVEYGQPLFMVKPSA
jgi:acetyl-CoA carboxylase biotin carboxyl carrier protein